FDMELLKLE
ncbi:FKBP prolyl isomerase family member 1C, partial [Daubentonia madagascariensis]